MEVMILSVTAVISVLIFFRQTGRDLLPIKVILFKNALRIEILKALNFIYKFK